MSKQREKVCHGSMLKEKRMDRKKRQFNKQCAVKMCRYNRDDTGVRYRTRTTKGSKDSS